MDLGIRGQACLIVGGARGIGYATAQALAAEGVKLALADIDGAAASNSATRLAEASGTQVVGLPVDITNLDQVRNLVTQAEAAIGPLSILINSAAVLDDKLFVDSQPSDWKRMIDVCLFGPMNVIHTVLPGMMQRRYGRIVCLASDSARMGQARLSYYAAAKGGVVALTKSIAQEVGTTGVTLNILSPGATNTELRQAREVKMRAEMGEEKYARREKTVLRMYPVGRIGEPEDIASAVTFLVSKRASWITGQVLSVNGGFAMP
ncbi:SDR family NAD(P)-dependent oxidoreductase [Enterovirga sp.]|jgi:NAD(P)-dependent dehydrogenase (short-subunit alcohol dehydrogenase family)|uniref:SDR family NAD(P)-dependent oxidoreductase n=1 Tax=Enterovirga sp. TaxID=2026350 RepID=UPI002603FB6F|nr:SDR family NAD(P)-dependent oxidoreductase [Enterovirga sp.]MDB5592984.1 fabG3 [Enterovirga sp.]